MKQKPIAISLLLCEQVIVDERSRNATPVNCFNARELEAFPGLATFWALAWLADGAGQMPLRLTIHRLDSLETVFVLDRAVQFPSPLHEMRCAIRVRECPFPVAGHYEAVLWVDDELIAHRKFAVRTSKAT